MLLSYKYRLYPTRAQAEALTGMLGAFCDLYNAALDQRIQAYRRGVRLRYGNQAGELKAVRAGDERLAGFSFSAEQQVLRRLDKAFSSFFRRLKERDGKAGFPRFKAKSRFDSAELRVGDGLTIRKAKRLGIVGIPGEIKCRWHRPLPDGAKTGAAVVSRSCGKWYICFQLTLPDADAPARDGATVGVDLGLGSLVALSNGETVPTPQHAARAAKALRRAQRAVARKRRHSRRQRKAKLKVARLHARIAAQRRDFSHKLSRSLVDRFSHIAFENLNVTGLARGMLAKPVANAAWNQLIQHVTYKAANAGGVIVLVDPRGTSQTCPDCGTVKPKKLSERMHLCECGCVTDRDVAAAKVVHQRAFGTRPGTGLQAPSQRVAA